MMNKLSFFCLLICLFFLSCNQIQYSPEGRLKLVYEETEEQLPAFRVFYLTQDKPIEVMHLPVVGILSTDGIGVGLKLKENHSALHREGGYTMLTGKRRYIYYEANEYTYTFMDSLNHEIRMVFRLYNDGVAFRYEIPQLDNALLQDELTTYRIPEGQKRWVQSYDPSYERFYPESVTGESENKHWAYPALFQVSDEMWMLISEAGIEKYHSASSLKNEGNVTDYKVALGENKKPFSGDWYSPWRIAIIGSLADVVESTLITDVSPESRLNDNCPEWIQPGAVSWIYWAYNHGSNDYQIVKKYIDMAVELSLPYVLIDAEWDEMGNGGTIEDALAYARECGVKPLIWYNSSTGWIKEWGAPGPHERLNDPVKREKEFAWLNEMGVVGVKIDFFAGDTQETMEYCIDLLESAAKYKLMVNFHGATIPRGWQRTYPHLMTVEGVYGAEWYNNRPILTTRAAKHNSTLPFTRNVIGPMDYTPCTFSDSQHPHITTHAHELALPVLYESALQHLADRPESYLAQPEEVKNFLSELPTAWDETRLLAGYPGQSVVMARCKEGTWYIGGLNGTEETYVQTMDWSFLGEGNYSMLLFEDGNSKEEPWKIVQVEGKFDNFVKNLNLQPRGGFVAVVKPIN